MLNGYILLIKYICFGLISFGFVFLLNKLFLYKIDKLTEEDENLTYYLNVLLVKEQNREQNTNFKNLSDFLLSDHGKERLEEEEEIIRSSIEDYFCDDSVTREEAQEELREIVEGFWSEVGESFSNID